MRTACPTTTRAAAAAAAASGDVVVVVVLRPSASRQARKLRRSRTGASDDQHLRGQSGAQRDGGGAHGSLSAVRCVERSCCCADDRVGSLLARRRRRAPFESSRTTRRSFAPSTLDDTEDGLTPRSEHVSFAPLRFVASRRLSLSLYFYLSVCWSVASQATSTPSR